MDKYVEAMERLKKANAREILQISAGICGKIDLKRSGIVHSELLSLIDEDKANKEIIDMAKKMIEHQIDFMENVQLLIRPSVLNDIMDYVLLFHVHLSLGSVIVDVGDYLRSVGYNYEEQLNVLELVFEIIDAAYELK